MGTLLYGSGLRLMECLRVRVRDVDFGRHQITLRNGKRGRDRLALPSRSAERALGPQSAAASPATSSATASRRTPLEAGSNIGTVQELLGHRSVKTARIYTHVLDRRPMGVRSPVDRLQPHVARIIRPPISGRRINPARYRSKPGKRFRINNFAIGAIRPFRYTRHIDTERAVVE